jgi:glycerol kinase
MTFKSAKPHVLALDCGTTGNRAIVFDRNHKIKANAYREFTQYYPKPGWVEHDADEIWRSVRSVLKNVLKKIPASSISSIGITNQRETLVLWNKRTGKPVCRAIVWQCRRTADICAALRKKGLEPKIHQDTGLFLDPYFTGSKLRWVIENNSKVAQGLREGSILWGTIDTWIIWKLTGGAAYSTDPTNASRTLLYNIRKGAWDPKLFRLFNVPLKNHPAVLPSCGIHGYTKKNLAGISIPIAGVVGDQQSAAFAQGCSPKGIVKNTYGTGLFVVADTGHRLKISKKLITTVAASATPKLRYALEGSIFIGGAAIQWLRDGLKIIKSAKDAEKMAASLKTNDGVYFVPALAGLGCPHWDPHARGTFVGITRQTTEKHFVRAAEEALAYQTKDVVDLFHHEMKIPIRNLRVDGGAVRDNFLMQFQADILGCVVERPVVIETTALGAAALAGIATGVWKSHEEFLKKRRMDRLFKPKMTAKTRNTLHHAWTRAVSRSLAWA